MTTRHTIRYLAVHGRRMLVRKHLGEGLYLADDAGIPTLIGPEQGLLLRLDDRDLVSELARLLNEG